MCGRALRRVHGLKRCVGLDADYALSAVRKDLVELNVSQVDLVLLHAPCASDHHVARALELVRVVAAKLGVVREAHAAELVSPVT